MSAKDLGRRVPSKPSASNAPRSTSRIKRSKVYAAAASDPIECPSGNDFGELSARFRRSVKTRNTVFGLLPPHQCGSRSMDGRMEEDASMQEQIGQPFLIGVLPPGT